MCTVRVWNLVDTCFNRYMVECESRWVFYKEVRIWGFNRYMVECEYKCPAGVWTIGYGF